MTEGNWGDPNYIKQEKELLIKERTKVIRTSICYGNEVNEDLLV